MEPWYWTELPNVIWLQRILRPVSGLGDMTATARQPSLITPLNLSSVLDLTGEIINFVIISGQGSDVSQMTIAL